MWQLILVAGLIAPPAQQSVQDVQSRLATIAALRPDPLELTIASPVQLPAGREVGTSVRSAAGPEPWLVYSRGNFCQSVITRGPASADATDGWKVSVVERSRTATHVTVGVTWSRMWERGRLATNASGGTSELVLQRGDRIPLDSITRPSEPGVCAGTTKGLEIQVGSRMMIASDPPSGDAPIEGPVDVELWMVHATPNGGENVERQVVRVGTGSSGFSFRGASFETTDGVVYLELTGRLKAVRREDGSRGLWAGLTRSVVRQATAGTAFAGATNTIVGWLTPGEVVSFDLPPVQLFAGGARSGGRGGVVSGGGGGGGRGGVIGRAGASGGGGGVATGVVTPGLPNLLEGHRLSLRVRLVESR